MAVEMWITLGILIAAIVLFVTEWLRVDVVAVGVVVALMLSGVLTTSEALAGFSSPAVLTIAALFVVGGGVLQTGLAQTIGERILKIAGKDETRLSIVIMLAIAIMSGFMSDTGVVAVMLPAIVSLASSTQIPPSKLLIPMAFGSLLGGSMTLIGTPPNIIVTNLLRDQGLEPFGFFSFTPMGAVLVAAGVIFMVFVGRRLLPLYLPKHDIQPLETPEELMDLYRLPDNLFQLRVRRTSPLSTQTLREARLGERFEVNVLEILRPAEPQTVAKLGEQRLVLQSDTYTHIYAVQDEPLQPNDILIVQGIGSDVSQAAAYWNLGIQPASPEDREGLISQEAGIAEILLPPRSKLIGKNLIESSFGSVYHLTVLDIRRPGSEHQLNLKQTRLSFGDTLLVQGEWKNILTLKRHRRDFVVMGEPEAIAGPPARKKAPIAFVVLIAMMALIVADLTSVAAASLVAALIMVLTGCLSMDDAYGFVDWKSLVLVAGMLPMATALEHVGLVNVVATGFTNTLGSLGPQVTMAGLFLLTSLFTQVLSNTATAVLIAPIALAVAQQLDVSPYAFLMTVAIAASMAFASPVASPVNTLVMGAGNYSFKDYLRVGLPLIIVIMVVVVLVLPLLWPF